MHTTDELKEIYEGRYNSVAQTNGSREEDLYTKYRRLIFGKNSFVKVLDLGCGLGFKTKGFTKLDEQVLAIDLSENAIRFCRTHNHLKNIEYKVVDAMCLNEKFHLITAFGFSLFNTKSTNKFIDIFEHFYNQNLVHLGSSSIIIGSFTDFSGKGEHSWYLHTKKDLADIIRNLEQRFSVKVTLFFPHRSIKNYIGFGLYNFVAEVVKLMLKRKRTFFIQITHE
jgi:SAM-dependent methyltransferase